MSITVPSARQWTVGILGLAFGMATALLLN
jgi:hypothetical protein